MPQRKAAVKRLRADKKRRQRNNRIKRVLKKSLKDFNALSKDGKKDELLSALKDAFAKLDKAAKKGVIHKNTADRKKGRLHKRFTRLSAKDKA